MDIPKIINELTLEEKARLVVGKTFWTTQEIERLGIPSIKMCDGPHGLRKQVEDSIHSESVKATCFPTASALACSFNVELAVKVGDAIAKECRNHNVDILLGPGINMKRSPLGGRNFEYFSEDPYLTGKIAAAYINGVQKNGVGVSLKHFLCNEQEYQRMSTDSIVDERALREIYLEPFRIAIKEAKPMTIMSSYNKLNGEYVSESKELLHNVLRNEYGFDGFIMSDWGSVNDRVAGIRARMNLEMPTSGEYNVKKIVEAVNTKELEIAKLDLAVKDILEIIEKLHLKHNGNFKNINSVKIAANIEKNHKLSVDAAAESIVLLENNGVLPLDKDNNICVIGALAKSPRIQGAGSSKVNCSKSVSPLEEIEKEFNNVIYSGGYSLEDAEDEGLINEALRTAENAETVVLFVGFDEKVESEGFDKKTIRLSKVQETLIKELKKLNNKLVVVLQGGSAVLFNNENIDAVIMSYLSGQGMAEALTAILTGCINPSGKLAETFPADINDTPAFPFYPGKKRAVYHESIYVGYRHYDTKQLDVLYPFGHGLSYTNFSYSDLVVEGRSVSLKVQNTGKYSGYETVQLYIKNETEKINTPQKDLRGFKKVYLDPSERCIVSFELTERDFSYYDEKDGFTMIDGKYSILIGASSRDIRLQESTYFYNEKRKPFSLDNHVSDFLDVEGGDVIVQWAFEGMSIEYDKNDVLKEKDKNFLVNMALDMPLTRIPLYTSGEIELEMIQEQVSKINKLLNIKKVVN